MTECNSLYQLASELWKKYGAATKAAMAATGPEGAAVATAVSIAQEMGRGWNAIVGNTSLKIGPRYLLPNQTLTGTVVLATERTFMGGPSKVNSTITFRKTDGDATGDVRVCSFDESGKHKVLKTIELSKDTPDGKTFQVSVPREHAVSLIVDSESLTKKLSYSVRMELEPA